MPPGEPEPRDGHGIAVSSKSLMGTIAKLEQSHALILDMLQKIDRRLTTVEEKLLASNVKEPKQEGFPQFKMLPLELRSLIWEMSIPRRKLRLGNYSNRENSKHKCCGLPPPVATKVCHESREVACKRGNSFLLDSTAESNGTAYEYWTWFDGSRDVVQIPDIFMYFMKDGYSDSYMGLMKVLRQADEILITTRNLLEHESWADELLGDQQVRRTLRTIYIQRTHSEIAYPSRWHPQATAKLFHDSPLYILDLENRRDVKHIRRLQSLNPPRLKDLFNKWMRIWKEHEEQQDKVLTTSWARELFLKAWLSTGGQKSKMQEHILPDGKIDKEAQWVQQRLPGMPRVCPVYVIEQSAEVCSCLDDYEEGSPSHPVYDIFFRSVPNPDADWDPDLDSEPELDLDADEDSDEDSESSGY